MAEHTPGPWRVGDAGTTIFGPPNGNPSPIMVAQRVRRANARLIAAAPELLAALEGCRGYFEWMAAQQTEHLTSGAAYAPDAAWLQPIRAAIAKAKGEAP